MINDPISLGIAALIFFAAGLALGAALFLPIKHRLASDLNAETLKVANRSAVIDDLNKVVDKMETENARLASSCIKASKRAAENLSDATKWRNWEAARARGRAEGVAKRKAAKTGA